MNDGLKQYLNDIDFLEAPLKGLLKKDMTNPDELRAFVQQQRLMRESRQSFKAMITSDDVESKEKEKKPSIFDNFEE